ncbi:hypothetical protein DL98DRAFT_538612 [Cadophora sp. DSE1049]|nr:hypothetical protein DL98DRAFT_538612 [Cadophora sp. DSE1049]
MGGGWGEGWIRVDNGSNGQANGVNIGDVGSGIGGGDKVLAVAVLLLVEAVEIIWLLAEVAEVVSVLLLAERSSGGGSGGGSVGILEVVLLLGDREDCGEVGMAAGGGDEASGGRPGN